MRGLKFIIVGEFVLDLNVLSMLIWVLVMIGCGIGVFVGMYCVIDVLVLFIEEIRWGIRLFMLVMCCVKLRRCCEVEGKIGVSFILVKLMIMFKVF